MSVVPVLLYHAVTETPGDHVGPYTVTPRMFEQQLDAVIAEGFTCITFEQFVAGQTNNELWPPKPAVITFDDGYADFASNALPALLARNLVSTMFLNTGWLEGRPGRAKGPTDKMLDWSQVKELDAAGVEIGAHSHNHYEMDTLSKQTLRDELHVPKVLLEDELSKPISTFAYPHGYNGMRVRAATKRAGYTSAAGVRMALSHQRDHAFNIARLMLGSDTTPERFDQWLKRSNTPVAKAGESPLTTGWRILRRTKATLRHTPGSVYT